VIKGVAALLGMSHFLENGHFIRENDKKSSFFARHSKFKKSSENVKL
jgi:hypothetical protein